MSVNLSLLAGAGWQFFTDDGVPLAGGLLYTYAAGTTTPQATYTSISGLTAHANPIVLNSAGRVAVGEVWLTNGYSYKFLLKDASNVQIASYDNIPGFSSNLPIINDASSIAYEQGFTVTAGSFVAGNIYLITSVGTTNFIAIGASANTVGVHFTATGAGSGTGTAQLSRTVQVKLQENVSVKDFGAVGDGVTDDTAAIQAAIDAVCNESLGTVFLPAGVYKITSTLTDYNTVSATSNGKTVRLVGVGSSEVSTDTPLTKIVTVGAIVGIQFNGNRSGGENFIIEGDNGAFDGTSHGIVVESSRSRWVNIVSTKHRGDGIKFRFGNVSHFESILCLSNRGNGLNIDGTGYVTPAGVSRPNDANASTFITIDTRTNGLVGVRTGANSTFSNFFYNLTSQSNTGYGVQFNGDYNRVFGLYVEGNDVSSTPAYDINFSSTADNNNLFGVFSNYTYPADATNGVFLDSSTNKRNYVQPFTQSAQDIFCNTVTFGNTTGGVPGYVVFNGDNGTTAAITLEGTSGTQSLVVTSSGAGKFGLNPDFIAYRVYTVATLPSAATLGAGAKAFVSDANATTFASVVAGGGANNIPVYSNGTNWRIG